MWRALVGLRSVLVLFVAGGLGAGALFAYPLTAARQDDPFPHGQHEKMFPLCTTCHAGVVDSTQALWPDATGCASCHDGVTKKRVVWTGRTRPLRSNLTFTHRLHDRAVSAKNPADSVLVRNCSACHVPGDTLRMTVQRAVVGQCLECHGLPASHVDNAGTTCATCHTRLTDATGLTRADIADFPKPASHHAEDFALGGHGRGATVRGVTSGPAAIAANCATCHARNLCVSCHVNAREVPPIRALATDARVPARHRTVPAPASHTSPVFLRTHGNDAKQANATCATCHARESCTTCHVNAVPKSANRLANTDTVGRAVGAVLTRTPPANHTTAFRERHAADAGARPQSCATCHQRSMCLQCHRPENGAKNRYHPQNFLTRHPSSAYTREANCSDCHNPAQFCQSCHQQSGLVATATRIGRAGYHDAYRGFSLGHGQAARQSLETCASCHAERDCTSCHSAVGGGFRFSPHGPGFNAARMQAKNPSVCIACHGRVIPR